MNGPRRPRKVTKNLQNAGCDSATPGRSLPVGPASPGGVADGAHKLDSLELDDAVVAYLVELVLRARS
jgi:hypothetical protein